MRPGGFELPTFWFVAKDTGNLSASSGVAYGRFCCFPCSSIVRKLSVDSPILSHGSFREGNLRENRGNRKLSHFNSFEFFDHTGFNRGS